MKRERLLDQLADAYGRLREALEIDMTNELAVDGTIQRFEFCYELAWKTIKAYLDYVGISRQSPRDCFREAFQAKWIADEMKWLELLNARNLTSHVYDENMAKEIYDIIRKDSAVFGELIEKLKAVNYPLQKNPQ